VESAFFVFGQYGKSIRGKKFTHNFDCTTRIPYYILYITYCTKIKLFDRNLFGSAYSYFFFQTEIGRLNIMLRMHRMHNVHYEDSAHS